MSEHRSPKTVSIGEREVGPDCPAFVVAEVGSNHNGDLSLARRLIDVAVKAGVDAVKFQLFRAEDLYPPNCGTVNSPIGPVDFYNLLTQLALPPEWIPELKTYAEERDVVFLCTPFDEAGITYLSSVNITGIKIASSELNHLPLLRAAARYQRPLICSTGLSYLWDIEEALQTIRQAWAHAAVILLHCVSAYPLPSEEANLGAVQTLEKVFDNPVGFSDHTTDPVSVPCIAVASGACMIEKHYTLSRLLAGPDHPFALEEDELRAMVRAIREVERVEPLERLKWVSKRFGREKVKAILGHGRKEIMPAERELYPNDKRSIRAIKDIPEREALSYQNIRILRSERNLKPGLHPRYWEIVLGSRAVRHMAAGEGVCWEHLLSR
jgi:N,N'-diacetyllegionaminate synthase